MFGHLNASAASAGWSVAEERVAEHTLGQTRRGMRCGGRRTGRTVLPDSFHLILPHSRPTYPDWPEQPNSSKSPNQNCETELRATPEHPAASGFDLVRSGASAKGQATGGASTLPLVAVYNIYARLESNHFPQAIPLRRVWKRLPNTNIIISAPMTSNTKKLKWQRHSIEKVMEEVYRCAGSLEELKRGFENQEQTA
ncbi:hypothetical protein NDU88_004045 [Pleurodeles waltl]|uniref:Uncharacterized protein n=1 Tax=Pleurodeles waltl TaxID=8319 RepID=A0AAV7W748_PLEWA|nr:hypothetical protein NDU88_004045 [Pleurodeles waltl]